MAQVWICALLACDLQGAPRIHGELLMLGFDVSERTISRWMRRAPRDPELGKRWLAFLRNYREASAAMDFFTVPTITFGVLYGFFVTPPRNNGHTISPPGIRFIVFQTFMIQPSVRSRSTCHFPQKTSSLPLRA
jgi:hypothetical protein